jgi:hypothetical protein
MDSICKKLPFLWQKKIFAWHRFLWNDRIYRPCYSLALSKRNIHGAGHYNINGRGILLVPPLNNKNSVLGQKLFFWQGFQWKNHTYCNCRRQSQVAQKRFSVIYARQATGIGWTMWISYPLLTVIGQFKNFSKNFIKITFKAIGIIG